MYKTAILHFRRIAGRDLAGSCVVPALRAPPLRLRPVDNVLSLSMQENRTLDRL